MLLIEGTEETPHWTPLLVVGSGSGSECRVGFSESIQGAPLHTLPHPSPQPPCAARRTGMQAAEAVEGVPGLGIAISTGNLPLWVEMCPPLETSGPGPPVPANVTLLGKRVFATF